MVTCGTTAGTTATIDLQRLFWNQLSVVGSTMGDMDEFRQATALLISGALTPVIDQVIDAEEGIRGWQELETGTQFGKIVLDWR